MANGGNDLIINHRSVTVGGFLPTSMATSGMTLSGGGGTDTLVLDDSGNGFFGSYDVTSSTFDCDIPFATTGTISYSNFEEFDLVETNGPDVTTVASKVSGTTMLIETIDGNDSVTVGGGAINSNGFAVSNTDDLRRERQQLNPL
jgi:hypothetical protein